MPYFSDAVYAQVVGQPRSHLSETALSPASAGEPTRAEVLAYCQANSIVNRILFYTRSDDPADPIAYTYLIDSEGIATPVAGEVGGAKNHVFAGESAVSPVLAGEPTFAEIEAFVIAGGITDTLVFYTGTDVATDEPLLLFHVDASGSVKKLAVASGSGVGVYRAPVVPAGDRNVAPVPADLVIADWVVGSIIYRDTAAGIRQLWQADTTTTAVLDSEEFPTLAQPLAAIPTDEGWVDGERFVVHGPAEGDARMYQWRLIGATLTPVQIALGGVFNPSSGGGSGGGVPVMPVSGWNPPADPTVDRDLDVGTLQDVSRVLSTIIRDLQAAGIFLT